MLAYQSTFLFPTLMELRYQLRLAHVTNTKQIQANHQDCERHIFEHQGYFTDFVQDLRQDQVGSQIVLPI